jgi:hypothetical protein
MKTANYLRPMNGYVIAKWEDTREHSILFQVVGIAKDEEELKAGDLIEVLSKDYDQIDNYFFFTDAFRLSKSDIIGVYVSMSDDQKMFKPFDLEEE